MFRTVKRQQKYFNLETFDYTPYARELTEEEMYLVNGGRQMKSDRTNDSEYVSSRPAPSNESGNSSGSSSTSNSSPAPTATQPSTTSSQQNNTSAPTCTAAQMAAAQGAAMNAYFAEQDKRREENNKQKNSSSSSSSSSSSDNNSTTQSSNSDSENLTDKAYPSSRDENYGQAPSSGITNTSSNAGSTNNFWHKDEPVPGQNLSESAIANQESISDSTNNDSLSNINSSININKTFYETKSIFAASEGVGFCSETVKVNCYTDTDGKLNVSALGLFSGKNNISVNSYFFGGNVTLIVNGEEKERKNLQYPDYPFFHDGAYDYIGSAVFDTNFNYSDKIEILSKIDLVVNNGFARVNSKKYLVR